MYLSIINLSLLGSIVSGFFGRKVGVSGAQFITCLGVIITTVLAVISFFEVGFDDIIIYISLFKWLDSELFNIVWAFQFDSLTVSMLIPVLVISSLVHIYSIGYMNGDPHNQRFFSYLSLFTFMMIILVTANNYLLMFVGWEGVGVCSYLLVSFWFTRIAANQSSMSAFLTNRVGDCFLTIGIFAILWSLGNLNYTTVFSLAPYINENVITIIGICLLISAMAKSSQVGLHVWLPMAMEGPTPVSALIHAATMVTAGVYLLMRSSPLIEYSSTVLLLCLWLGAITTVFSSLVGLFQQDIKKVIAYSTMSQLGMMVIAVGLSSYNVALFHLINHAFYKGLLFLGAGAVIHAVADNQDFRKYGGLISFLPLSYSVILIASLSLVAFPFMTGFYSKDFILESAYGQYCFSSITVYTIAVIGAIFTTLYSVKVLYLTFLTNPNGSVMYYKHAHEGNIFISLPLVILAIFSIFFGFITKDIFIGLGSNFFTDNSIFIHPNHEIMINTEFAVPSLFKLLPFIFTILFSIIAIILSEFLSELIVNFKLSNLGRIIFGFFNQRFLVELFYNKYITNLVLNLGGQTTKILDKGSIESLGPYGLEKVLMKISKAITNLNTGIVTNYAFYIFIGFIVLISTPFLVNLNINMILLIILSVITILNFKNNINNNNNILLESNLSLVLPKIKFEYFFLIKKETIEKHLPLLLIVNSFFFPYILSYYIINTEIYLLELFNVWLTLPSVMIIIYGIIKINKIELTNHLTYRITILANLSLLVAISTIILIIIDYPYINIKDAYTLASITWSLIIFIMLIISLFRMQINIKNINSLLLGFSFLFIISWMTSLFLGIISFMCVTFLFSSEVLLLYDGPNYHSEAGYDTDASCSSFGSVSTKAPGEFTDKDRISENWLTKNQKIKADLDDKVYNISEQYTSINKAKIMIIKKFQQDPKKVQSLLDAVDEHKRELKSMYRDAYIKATNHRTFMMATEQISIGKMGGATEAETKFRELSYADLTSNSKALLKVHKEVLDKKTKQEVMKYKYTIYEKNYYYSNHNYDEN